MDPLGLKKTEGCLPSYFSRNSWTGSSSPRVIFYGQTAVSFCMTNVIPWKQPCCFSPSQDYVRYEVLFKEDATKFSDSILFPQFHLNFTNEFSYIRPTFCGFSQQMFWTFMINIFFTCDGKVVDEFLSSNSIPSMGPVDLLTLMVDFYDQ